MRKLSRMLIVGGAGVALAVGTGCGEDEVVPDVQIEATAVADEVESHISRSDAAQAVSAAYNDVVSRTDAQQP